MSAKCEAPRCATIGPQNATSPFARLALGQGMVDALNSSAGSRSRALKRGIERSGILYTAESRSPWSPSQRRCLGRLYRNGSSSFNVCRGHPSCDPLNGLGGRSRLVACKARWQTRRASSWPRECIVASSLDLLFLSWWRLLNRRQ